MFARILVPLDGTSFAEQALPWAVPIAKRFGASIELVTVEVPPPLVFPDVNFITPLSEAELGYLDRVADRVRDQGVTDVNIEVLEGNAPVAIEERRAQIGADLTVMATHGRGPIARSWLGSVADQFVRRTEAPALMVRPSADTETVDLSVEPEIGSIVVTVDGSELSETAIPYASELARMYEAQLTVVRVIEYPRHTESVYLPDAVEAIEEHLEESRVATEKELERMVATLDAEGAGPVRHKTKVVVHAAEGILDLAEASEADVIVMASHGRGGVRRLVLGSVTDKVLRGSTHPLLIVRTD